MDHIKDVIFVTLEASILYYVAKEYYESHNSNKLLRTLINLLKVKRPGRNTTKLIKEVLNVGIKGN